MDDTPSFPTPVSNLLASLEETLSAATHPSLADFAAMLNRLKPILHSLLPHHPSDRRSVESLSAELRRARDLLRWGSPSPHLIEGTAHSIGRCVGLLDLTCADAPVGVREAMASLHSDMIGAGREIVPDLEDVLLQVKKGDEQSELGVALSELGLLVSRGAIGDIGGSVFVPVLLHRLSSASKDNRLKLILLLRTLASHSGDNKERMAGVEALSCMVRSLARDAEESREAVGLLLDLSDVPTVRQRIGRIQGCIVMLATLFNGDDPFTARDAGKLLELLSSNTQNVLLMAEAGYFIPLVRYLKDGSDMNKILMATAISRIELTEQMKASLGEEGSIEPLVKMFTSGKLEAKLSALGALQNLSSMIENIPLLIDAGIIAPLFQLLFSVTSVLMTLREPASSILASIAQSEIILKYKNVTQQMLSLLNLSSPTIQLNLLIALKSIVSHSNAKRIRAKMKENGAIQVLIPFLTESNSELRIAALEIFFNLSKDFAEDLTKELGQTHLNTLVHIISTSVTEKEKAAAVGILSNLPVKDKTATEILARANLLPVLISLLEVSIKTSSNPTKSCLIEGIVGVMVRFTVPWDKGLQRLSAAHGLIPCLINLLSDGSAVAKSRAATSLAQLSQNSVSLNKVKLSRWLCVPHSSQIPCELHNRYCTVKSTFCLLKAGAVSPLLQTLEGKEREPDEAVLNALVTLMQDETWEKGTIVIEKASGIPAILRVLEVGSLKAQQKAVWMLERIFRLEAHREKYAEAAGVVLIDLAQKSDQTLKPMIAKVLAHLQLLQEQSSYF